MRSRRWWFGLLYSSYLIMLGVAGFRGYLRWQFGIQPTDLSNRIDVVRLYYPELLRRKISDTRIGGDKLQVLLLGGSVAEQIGDALQHELSATLGIPVAVHNAAMSAHTTQDSLNKLEYLLEQSAAFDGIVIYHGINDVRMNCVPPDEFQSDYTHCHWYASFQRKKKQGSVSVREEIEESLDRLIELGEPEPDYAGFGAEIKTGPAFEAHIERMLGLAEQHGIPVALLSFATHFVDGYSKTAFQAKQLGYADGAYGMATEVWGHADNVRRGVVVHNEFIRKIAAGHSQLTFIDMEMELTDIDFFTDVCHLSPAGIQRFVQVAVQEIRRSDFLSVAVKK